MREILPRTCHLEIRINILKRSLKLEYIEGKICAITYQKSFLSLWKYSYLQKKEELLVWNLVASCIVLIAIQQVLGGIFHLIY